MEYFFLKWSVSAFAQLYAATTTPEAAKTYKSTTVDNTSSELANGNSSLY